MREYFLGFLIVSSLLLMFFALLIQEKRIENQQFQIDKTFDWLWGQNKARHWWTVKKDGSSPEFERFKEWTKFDKDF